MITLDELKLLLSLNGNQRLPHLESEIFSGTIEMRNFYLECMTRFRLDNRGLTEYVAFDHARIRGQYDAEWAVYMYSKLVIKGRWKEAECVFAINSTWWTEYKDLCINKVVL